MKALFNIALVIFTSIFLFSCRSLHDEIPQDIHEHEDLEKLVVTLTNKNNSADIQTINYIGGVADAPIHAHAGEVYLVELDFQVKHDNHYESVNPEIITEKDEHFITYIFTGADIKVKRTNDDVVRTDGKKLGLKTEWTVVSSTNSGKVNIKLVHAASSVDDNSPSADNQLGTTVGGESDVNAFIDLH